MLPRYSFEAEIRHHRRDDARLAVPCHLLEAFGDHAYQLVAVDFVTALVDDLRRDRRRRRARCRCLRASCGPCAVEWLLRSAEPHSLLMLKLSGSTPISMTPRRPASAVVKGKIKPRRALVVLWRAGGSHDDDAQAIEREAGRGQCSFEGISMVRVLHAVDAVRRGRDRILGEAKVFFRSGRNRAVPRSSVRLRQRRSRPGPNSLMPASSATASVRGNHDAEIGVLRARQHADRRSARPGLRRVERPCRPTFSFGVQAQFLDWAKPYRRAAKSLPIARSAMSDHRRY